MVLAPVGIALSFGWGGQFLNLIGFMSVRIMSAVWEDLSIQNQSDLLVLLALADFSNDAGDCWPAISTIAKKSRHSERGVQKIIERLQLSGKLNITIGGKGPRDTNTYHINLKGEPGSTLRVNPSAIRVNGDTIRVNPSANKGEQAVHPNHQYNHHIEPSVQPSVMALPEKFKTSRMVGKWGMWMNARRGMKKPKSWILLFNEQLEWLSTFDEPTAHEILSASIRNGWQGLFPPKQRYQSNDTMPLFAQTKLIEEAIQKHKANRDGSYFDSQCTDQDRQNLKALRTKLKDVKDQQLNGIISK